MRVTRWGAALGAVTMLAFTLTPPGPAQAAAAADTWTGTWAASPQSGGTSFNQQTIRQIVRTSIGGTAARIQLSNAFGDRPLVVSEVHVARRTSGSSIDPGTDRRVTFGGQPGVTIPVGALAASDAVAFTVPTGADVVVSLYLPQPTGPATYHQSGLQNNYVAAGNQSGSATLTGAQTNGSYYFLANLDVQNPAAEGAVVTLGASITDGIGSGFDVNRRWPNHLARNLASAGRTIGVLNQGISGNKLLQDGAGQSALKRFDRDVLNQPGVRWVIFSDDPINDLGAGSGRPGADQLIAGLRQLIDRAHQRGVRFLCSTLTPFQGSGGWSAEGEQSRAAINNFVRSAGSGCDGVVDQDNATHDPARPTWFLPAYDTGDHLHPNEAGLQAIANAVNPNLFTGGGTPPPTTPIGAPTACGRLLPGQGLTTGQTLASCDGQFQLRLQSDGNLVLYQGTAVLWSTGTAGRAVAQAALRSDGDLTLTGSTGETIWRTATAGQSDTVFYVQGDGNLVIYSAGRPIWSSGTVVG
ncbi:GDSL-type esterase/lipase family protein [Micromonospora sp. NBC_01796]|uniref:GDSL-type esterase/lipase family protein n=1 Tax=Micromonospora sp. NBC_01796 TaxID=2975987 RepID=UPI002DDA710A|nr:GDSL-type esterase/lipase family protein [Micromonospora sp. NBC_01796]WSA86420.1 GDSL-type esterase/lipase family protein [Micromonospora sp. NBC_01796]